MLSNVVSNVLDLTKFVPDKIVVGNWNQYEFEIADSGETMPVGYQSNKSKELRIPEGRIGVYFNYKPFHSRNISRYIAKVLPRFVPYDELTRQVIGFLRAEMGKSLGGKRCNSIMNFSNSNPSAVLKALKWFERFNIKRSEWGWYVKLNLKFKNKQREVSNATYREFWKCVTQLSDEMAHPKYCVYSGVSGGRLCRKSPQWGTVVVERSDSIFRTILLKLVTEVSGEIEENGNKKEVADYLAGVLAGESTIYWNMSTKSHATRSIRISAPSSDDKIHYSRCLAKLGIKARRIPKGLQIVGLKNYLKVFDLGLMVIDPRRELEFLEMLLTYTRWRYSADLWNRYSEIKSAVEKRIIKLRGILKDFRELFTRCNLAVDTGRRACLINPRRARLQHKFLRLIVENPGISQSEIHNKFNIHPSTTRRVLAALKTKNFILQVPDKRFIVSSRLGKATKMEG